MLTAKAIRPAVFEGQITLADGTIAGVGYASTEASAQYFACLDAAAGGFYDAACGHARYLSERDEESVRAAVARRKNNLKVSVDKFEAEAKLGS